ncbi:heavy-metal-associated domain-containing protein [Lutimonas sp.]|uniref:heavy-metal-associated domain-containing protein n=1 Tax=Lutimonas sp. TaxID=1872403 RepID=UPI003C7819C7
MDHEYIAYFCKILLKIEEVKVLIKIFSISIIVLFFISCESRKEAKLDVKETSETNVVAQNLRQVKVDIKGMTCEIGCARLIQSKLYKADGVTFAKISFEDSSGIVKFDQNRISAEGIKKIIEKTAGGDIYTVTGIHKIDIVSQTDELQ